MSIFKSRDTHQNQYDDLNTLNILYGGIFGVPDAFGNQIVVGVGSTGCTGCTGCRFTQDRTGIEGCTGCTGCTGYFIYGRGPTAENGKGPTAENGKGPTAESGKGSTGATKFIGSPLFYGLIGGIGGLIFLILIIIIIYFAKKK